MTNLELTFDYAKWEKAAWEAMPRTGRPTKMTYAGTPGPGKTPNFGQAYTGRMSSSQPNLQSMAQALLVTCKRCGSVFPQHRSHGRRACTYRRALNDYAKKGYVHLPGYLRKPLISAGIKVYWGVHSNSAADETGRGPLQHNYYGPVWAVLLVEAADLGGLTSVKRPRVQAVIRRLEQAMADPEVQLAICGEHVLQGGPYIEACRSVIDRLTAK